MWEECTGLGFRGQSLKFTRIAGFLAILLGPLAFTAPVRADAISSAVLNYTGPYWAAFYSENLVGFNPSGSISLTLNDINPADGIEIEDPLGNHYFDSSLSLQINLLSGIPTTGLLQETTGDTYYSADFSQTNTVTPATLYSSGTLRGFGQIPSTTGVDYWFAFQNGSNPNNLIGGLIDSADVKTFAVAVPEPSSLVLSVIGIACAMGRFSRRLGHRAI